MSFVRPTLTELVTRIEADFVSRLTAAGAILRRAVVKILARVVAGAAHMLHGHLEFLGLQLFPDKSEAEYLIRQAALYGIAQTAPTFAIGLTVPLVGTPATVAPAGSVLIRSDGAEYKIDADATIGGGGTVNATVTAVVAGADGNAATGTILTFQSPIAGITSTVTLGGAGLENGTNQETIEELRIRLLARIAEPAHGGSDDDYVAWAKEVAGITRAWVTPLGLGPGTVVVRAVRDDDVGSIIPDGGELAVLQAHLDEVAPAHATVTAVAPVLVNQAYSIALTPNTTATRAAVTAELQDLTNREGAPGATIYLSHIRSAIGSAAGVTNYVMTVPAADVTHTANQFPGLGVITFT